MTRFFLIVQLAYLMSASQTHARGSDTDSLAQTLIQKTGDVYINARTELLQQSNEEILKVIEKLRAPEASLEQRVVGLFVKARFEHPERANEFEQALAEALAKPRPTAAAGRKAYDLKFDLGRLEAHPLLFEAVIKYDIPLDAKSRMTHSLSQWPNPLNIEPTLLLLDVKTPLAMRGHAVLGIGRIAREHEDSRIAPALKKMYFEERTAAPLGALCAVRRLLGADKKKIRVHACHSYHGEHAWNANYGEGSSTS